MNDQIKTLIEMREKLREQFEKPSFGFIVYIAACSTKGRVRSTNPPVPFFVLVQFAFPGIR